MPTSSKRQSDPLSVLIVGCGQIAGGYDRPDDEAIKTHAKAYLRQGGFRLAACVDPDLDRARDFARIWGISQAYTRLEEAAGQRYDVVSLCSPADAHAQQLDMLLDWDVGLVFCEKPLTDDLSRSRQLVEAYRAKGRPLVVNYQRRWEPCVRAMKAEIAAGEWGRLLTAHGLYTKGIYANGSHLIDLLQYLLGPVEPVMVTGSRIDHLPEDPTLSGLLIESGRAPITLSIGDHRCFTLFELDLLFERGRVTFADSGWTIGRRHIIDDPRYRGYRILEPLVPQASAMGQAFSAAVADIHAALTQDGELPSTGATALATHETCHRLHEMAAQSERIDR